MYILIKNFKVIRYFDARVKKNSHELKTCVVNSSYSLEMLSFDH